MRSCLARARDHRRYYSPEFVRATIKPPPFSGFDRGLRMGGPCKQKETGKRGIVLGILKKGITTARVQWEAEKEPADVPMAQLDHVEPTPFCVNRLTGVTLELLKFIARLGGVTGEARMPQYHLTAEEEKLLLPEGAGRERRKLIEMWQSSSDSQMCAPKKSDASRKLSAKTVESLSNEMVSNIMGEIRKLSSEKVQGQSEASEFDEELGKRAEMKGQLVIKLLSVELECLQLAFVQGAALKALNLLLTTNEYSQHFLFPTIFDKESAYEENTSDGEKAEAIKWIMSHVVNRSIQQCKLKSIVSVAEMERAQSILQLNHVKCKTEEDLNKVFSVEFNPALHRVQSSQHSDYCELGSNLEKPAPCVLRPSSSRFGMSLAFSDTATTTNSGKYF